MKKMYPKSLLVLVASLFLAATLSAQETKVTVKMERDGKTVKDTTYIFDDADQAGHALKMMELMCDDEDELLMEIHEEMAGLHEGRSHDILMDQDSVHTKKITVIVSHGEDGELEIISNDEQEIETEAILKEHGGGECEEVEVIIVKKKVKSEKQ